MSNSTKNRDPRAGRHDEQAANAQPLTEGPRPMRRRLLKGAAATPVVLTLATGLGRTAAATSAYQCQTPRLTNEPGGSTVEYANEQTVTETDTPNPAQFERRPILAVVVAPVNAQGEILVNTSGQPQEGPPRSIAFYPDASEGLSAPSNHLASSTSGAKPWYLFNQFAQALNDPYNYNTSATQDEWQRGGLTFGIFDPTIASTNKRRSFIDTSRDRGFGMVYVDDQGELGTAGNDAHLDRSNANVPGNQAPITNTCWNSFT